MASNIKQFVVNDTSNNEVVLVLKDKKFPWWILLFLLLLVFLIPINRTIKLHVTEGDSGIDMSVAPCTITYPKVSTFGAREMVTRFRETSTEGRVEFDSITEPLWYVILGSIQDSAFVSVANGCHGGVLADEYRNFPRDEYREMVVDVLGEDVVIKVVDADNLEPLPNASVVVTSSTSNGMDELTNAGGFVDYFFPYCGHLKIDVSKEGYESQSVEMSYSDLPGEELVIKLTPKTGSIVVIVKELNSDILLPDATVTLKCNGRTFTTTTNINGVGIAVFDDQRIDASVDLLAQKEGYADTTMSCSRVDEFQSRPDVERTMYLRPLTKNLVFIDTDGNNPLASVKNEIWINGNKKDQAVYSNADGQFIVSGVRLSDNISIVASKVGYHTNSTKVNNAVLQSLDTQESRTIPLNKNTPPPPPLNDLQGLAGDLRINLQWWNFTDLDLHVFDPCGHEFYYSNKRDVISCGAGRGSLDIDGNVENRTDRPQENCYFINPSSGAYRVEVVYYSKGGCSTPPSQVRFNITIQDRNGTINKSGSVTAVGQKVVVYTHRVN